MNTIYSPANIETLLHFHTKAEPHPRMDAPVVADAIKTFLIMGIIEPDGKELYKTTARGVAWVKALCNTPPPTHAYLDEQGRVL